jgi:hypothetical protein
MDSIQCLYKTQLTGCLSFLLHIFSYVKVVMFFPQLTTIFDKYIFQNIVICGTCMDTYKREFSAFILLHIYINKK